MPKKHRYIRAVCGPIDRRFPKRHPAIEVMYPGHFLPSFPQMLEELLRLSLSGKELLIVARAHVPSIVISSLKKAARSVEYADRRLAVSRGDVCTSSAGAEQRQREHKGEAESDTLTHALHSSDANLLRRAARARHSFFRSSGSVSGIPVSPASQRRTVRDVTPSASAKSVCQSEPKSASPTLVN